MTVAPVLYVLEDRIATITRNRPALMDVVNSAIRRDSLSALRQGAQEARVIILTGSGSGFCSGQDLGDVDLDQPEMLARILDKEYAPILKAIHKCAVPVTAAINGAALLAEAVSAQQAESWGMIWRSVPDDRLAQVAAATARQLADGPSEAVRPVTYALRASYGNVLDAQLALEADLQGRSLESSDFREGAAAFLDKRKPRFEVSVVLTA